MKRIEFIAPVEAMRGNLSGKQALEYPTDNNSAWLAPSNGKKQYARNYQPRFIGAKIAKSGKKYFAVRTKSAVNMSNGARLAMALMGATHAIYLCISRDARTIAQLQVLFMEAVQSDKSLTYYKWLCAMIRPALKEKRTGITLGTFAGQQIVYQNPYITSQDDGAYELINFPQEILVKFWSIFAIGGFYFTVDGKTGIGDQYNDNFESICNESTFDSKYHANVLNIQIGTVKPDPMSAAVPAVVVGVTGTKGDLWAYPIMDGATICDGDTDVVPDKAYTLGRLMSFTPQE